MKKKKMAGKILARIVAVISVFTVLITGISGIYVGTIIWRTDSHADMEVMELMRGSRTTRLYAPLSRPIGGNLTLENYDPVEVDIVYGTENMVWAESGEIPDVLRQAFIAIEDQGFYEHHGVEWGRTAYAALNQIFRFRKRFGASTITQQLIKNVHGDKEISVVRKITEIVRALRLEKQYTKDEILTYYLNIVPLGNGCVGVKSAARYYFDKDLSELTSLECATLAAVTNAPGRYAPNLKPEENRARRELVLRAMRECGYITEDEYRENTSQELVLNITDPVYTGNFHNWYTETVVADVARDLMKELDISEGAANALLYSGGLEIYTFMDPVVQKILDDCFEKEEKFYGEDGKKIEAGMVVCDPTTGDMLGVIGGVGEKAGARLFNRATDGHYQPGSVLKPLALYGLGIEKNVIHYATAFDDLPTETEDGYWPHNSPELYAGRITTHEALAKSKNTVAVQLLRLLGKETVYRHLSENVGLSGLISDGRVTDLAEAPLALGQLSYGTTVKELTEAYGSFANGGVKKTARSYLAVFDAKGKPILKNKEQKKRLWSEETAYIMTAMMSEVVSVGTAHRITLKEVVDTAGKTGTSGADRDKWFIGYTPYYVAGLHLAYDDRTPLPAAERRHLTIWDEVMQRLHAARLAYGEEPRGFDMPQGVVSASYCRDSGDLLTEACLDELRGDRSAVGYFKESYMPHTECRMHVEAHYNFRSGVYETGLGAEEDVNLYILSVPQRKAVTGVTPQDAPFTLEYLSDQVKKQEEYSIPVSGNRRNKKISL